MILYICCHYTFMAYRFQ